MPQSIRNADSIGGFDLTNGTFGIAPIDSLGVGGFVVPPQLNKDDIYDRTAFGLVLFTVSRRVRWPPYSRLGRAWIASARTRRQRRPWGVPLMRTKTWSVAIVRVLGASPAPSSYKTGAFLLPIFYFQPPTSSSRVHGHPRGHGVDPGSDRGGLTSRYLNIEGLSTIGSKIQDAGVDFDPTKYQFGIYGAIIVAHDAVPADRADSRTSAQDRARGGRARHAVLRRADARAR